MRYDPDRQHRRSLRLRGFDYGQQGAYFLTIVTQHRHCHLGEISGSTLTASEAGQMTETWWHKLPHRFPWLRLDDFVLMPNHLHAIAWIREDTPDHLGKAIGWFKSMTTNDYLRRAKSDGWRNLDGRLWQRNYYERVVRNDEELLRARMYIRDNPRRWAEDPENPAVHSG